LSLFELVDFPKQKSRFFFLFDPVVTCSTHRKRPLFLVTSHGRRPVRRDFPFYHPPQSLMLLLNIMDGSPQRRPFIFSLTRESQSLSSLRRRPRGLVDSLVRFFQASSERSPIDLRLGRQDSYPESLLQAWLVHPSFSLPDSAPNTKRHFIHETLPGKTSLSVAPSHSVVLFRGD